MGESTLAVVCRWTHHWIDGAVASRLVEPNPGISSSFRHVCAACIPNNLEFLKYDWKSESWNLVFAGGVLIGAFLAASFFSTDAPIALSEAAVTRMGELGIRDLSGQHPSSCFLGRSSATGAHAPCCWWRISGRVRYALRRRVHFWTRHHGSKPLPAPLFVAVLGFFTGGSS